MSATQSRQDGLADEISRIVPPEIEISDAVYEGPELVVYTTTPEKFGDNPGIIREIAVQLEKQITIRPDPDIRASESDAEAIIQQLVPEQAGITNIDFHPETSELFIEAERPGMVIGRGATTLQQITTKTGWDAEVLRTPPLESSTVRSVRDFLTYEREERRDVLQRIGRQIHRPSTASERYVRVTALGCAHEVGRAAFVLDTGETRILVDCGDKPGSDDTPYLQVPEGITADAHTIDAVVLTHAHLDHSALLPLLYKYGYDGPVYCTQPTRDLMGLLLLDYLKVAGKQGRTPPYESRDVKEALKHTITLDYDTITEIAPDIRITMKNAGHVLGSAVTHFNINDGETGMVFSGDIHYEDTKLFNGAVNQFPSADGLIMESTYGGDNDTQADQATAEEELKRIINETYQQGGKVLIPAFAVGRSQEIMLVLEEAMRNGDIPEIPVHLDGMIWEATAIHTAYPEYLRDEVRERIFQHGDNPFLHPSFNHIDGGDDERQRVVDGGPAIILTTSGMMTGGPIMSWIRYLAADPASTLAFVGYQADGTLGRQIQRGEREIEVETLQSGRGGAQRVTVELNMGVETVNGFSGHADRAGLMNFVSGMAPKPGKVMCVHGDPGSVTEFSRAIRQEVGVPAEAPRNLETVRFDRPK